MYLINAIYFKSSWTSRFDRDATSNAPFHALDGTSTPVPLMHQSSKLRMAYNADFSAVDLLYGNSAFSMTVILPHENRNVNDVLGTLSQSRWNELESTFAERQTLLFLPRFRLTWEKTLNDDLAAMGMGVAFTDFADFSRMSTRGLLISKVIQKTFVDVNEEGTEAAAATAVGMVPTSGPPTIRVDRPFIFVIRERFSERFFSWERSRNFRPETRSAAALGCRAFSLARMSVSADIGADGRNPPAGERRST